MKSKGLKEPSAQLYDPIRRRWVADTPEEKIRQRVIALLVEELGTPPSLIGVEFPLSSLPHLQGRSDLPKRRIDLLIYQPGAEIPLLLCECKAQEAEERAIAQLYAYNYYVEAPFVALGTPEGVFLVEGEKRTSVPAYRALLGEVEGAGGGSRI